MIRSSALMLLLCLSGTVSAQDLSCHNRIGGSWQFGSAPSGCNVSPLVSMSSVQRGYAPVVFDGTIGASAARVRYMSELFPVLRETGHYYLHRRNPNISDAEVAGFMSGLYALAHQESYWTHYRGSNDGIIRYMRGDNLHGHGLMQVDDRSHVAALKQGKGVDLIYNLIYGLDVYYGEWLRSANASCVTSSHDYVARARSAWAAYNGGPRSICRWTAGGSTDRDFYAKFTAKSWLAFVRDVAAPAAIDIKCLAEGPRPCGAGIDSFASTPFVNIEPQTLPPVILKSAMQYWFEITKLNQCYDGSCDFPRVDERSYDYALGRKIKAHLDGLALQPELLTDPRIENLALTLLLNDDGYVVEGALNVLSKLPTSPNSFEAILSVLDLCADAELIPSILNELKRYQSKANNIRIESALRKSMTSASPFVSAAVARNLGLFVSE